jgi:hypothetical protein
VWRGTGHVVVEHNYKWAIQTSTAGVDFWLTLDAAGSVQGYGIVRYGVWLDDSRLRLLLSWANTTGNSALALAPTVGPLIGMGTTKDIQGMRIASGEPVPVRMGKLGGQMERERLHLQFENGFDAFSYSLYREFPTKEETMRTGTAPAFSPFSLDAQVEKIGGIWQAVASNSGSGSTQSVRHETWSAQRVGPTP